MARIRAAAIVTRLIERLSVRAVPTNRVARPEGVAGVNHDPLVRWPANDVRLVRKARHDLLGSSPRTPWRGGRRVNNVRVGRPRVDAAAVDHLARPRVPAPSFVAQHWRPPRRHVLARVWVREAEARSRSIDGK